ncbi:MAG TPA: T9SS type A sorting domain-containing protein, partial [Aequorivita sp.]|nr:T9SS type A sorting domain-containing protein [Aequorivita sp.]
PFQMYGTEGLSVNNNTIEGFDFYPNPTHDVLNISAKKNIESVSLYNLLGQEVMATKVGATSSEINLSNLSAGTYLMEVTLDGETGTYKIMKK